MTLRIAVQMDPISSVDINGDTSFAFIEAAQERGHRVWTYQPQHLSWEMGAITARARPVTVQRVKEKPAIEGEPETLDLAAIVTYTASGSTGRSTCPTSPPVMSSNT